MKIALLTIWHEENYGAELQAYATIKLLRELNHDVHMIDIRLSDMAKTSVRGKVGHFLTFMGPAERKFRKFWRKNIPTIGRYKSLFELQKNPPDADVYMVGSDQVWNPEITKDFLNVYFLDFGGDDKRRISFASSFGTEHWKCGHTAEVASLLNRFERISCREVSGNRILKEVFNIDSENVLDPTLLLDSYEDLIGNVPEKPTLAYYPLSDYPDLIAYSNQLAGRLNLKAVNSNWKQYIYGKAVWNRNSVEDWMKSIAEAQFVITPSFHGVSMCLIHHRQFAVIVNQRNRVTRIEGLLKQLGIEDRIFYSFDELDNAHPWESKIDYTEVDLKLNRLRLSSLAFLRESLK